LSSTGRFSGQWWQWEKSQNKLQASDEASRRHYLVKDYSRYGPTNVFYPRNPEFDCKFGDADKLWFVYDSSLLEQTIKRYSKGQDDEKRDDSGLRIDTSWQQGDPRLLVIMWT